MAELNHNRFDQDEHEKYYFGCSSTEVYDSFKYSIIKCITSFMDECRKTLLEENRHVDKELIGSEIEALKEVYLKACFEELEKFKGVLQDIFSIPPNVDSLRKEVEELEKEFLREKMFLEILKQEKEIIVKLQPILLDTKMALSNLKNEEGIEKKEKLQKLLKRHDTFLKNLVCNTKIFNI
ncbi:hypothetical protein WA026_020014 [Henosepilachna vigintioctopunctata]|uniref:Protein MIS12 homolog n=1 Tax=Henosepilachna vigintioctopunctata TaxID=420089 RepID=A0AAW1V4H0_9CUCU